METLMLERYRAIRARMDEAARRAGRDPSSVHLVAVSKTHPFGKIAELYEAGQRDFGENYVQELLEKSRLAREAGLTDIRWHFIGHLQTNKVKVLLPEVSIIHGVGSEKLASEISKRAQGLGRKVPVLLEVNVDSQESKSGVSIPDLRKLAEAVAALPNLSLRGLMCIPDPERTGGPEEVFRHLASLEASLRPLTSGELSMGMTSDFESAIAAGATLVRVGTAIFGERPKASESL